MLTAATIPASAAAERFMDVKPGAWYYTAVDYAASEKLFSGTSSSTFSPNSPMTRAMFVRVLGNRAGIHPEDYPGSYFLDVPKGTWYTPYVQWAVGHEIVNGTGGYKFSPNQSVTREQMALILYNYAKTTDCDFSRQPNQLDRFSDGSRVSRYARTAMEWAISHKILGGSGGKLDPQGTATRAQVAQIFYNSRGLFGSAEEKPTPPPQEDTPKISITDEVRAKLKPNQDPEQIMDYILHGKHDDPMFSYDATTAQWDPALPASTDCGRLAVGSWENVESDRRSYYPINEDAARRAKEVNSFSDYRPGSTTEEYRRCVDEAAAFAERQKPRVDPMYHEKIDLGTALVDGEDVDDAINFFDSCFDSLKEPLAKIGCTVKMTNYWDNPNQRQWPSDLTVGLDGITM